MILYRLEHKSTELGPWAHTREARDFRHLDLMRDDGRCYKIPEPQTDGLKITEDNLFAFTSERDLLSYFSLDLLEKLLTWCGFRVVELQVSECKVGGRGVQAMFTKGAIIYKRTILEA